MQRPVAIAGLIAGLIDRLIDWAPWWCFQVGRALGVEVRMQVGIFVPRHIAREVFVNLFLLYVLAFQSVGTSTNATIVACSFVVVRAAFVETAEHVCAPSYDCVDLTNTPPHQIIGHREGVCS